MSVPVSPKAAASRGRAARSGRARRVSRAGQPPAAAPGSWRLAGQAGVADQSHSLAINEHTASGTGIAADDLCPRLPGAELTRAVQADRLVKAGTAQNPARYSQNVVPSAGSVLLFLPNPLWRI